MRLDDIKDYLSAEWDRTRSKLEDSATIQRLQESFQNLSVAGQRGVVIGVIAAILFVIFSIPWGYFSSSADTMVSFDTKRESLQDFYKTERQSGFLNEIPDATTAEAVQTSIQGQLTTMAILPEQMKPMEIHPGSSGSLLPKAIVQSEIVVSLKALNVKQIADVGAQIQSIHPLIRMKDIDVRGSAEHPQYFDVAYTLLLLKGKTL